jgi:hypothetical protein
MDDRPLPLLKRAPEVILANDGPALRPVQQTARADRRIQSVWSCRQLW